MYSPDVIASRLHTLQTKFSLRLHRYDQDESLSIAQSIERKYDSHQHAYLNLTTDEQTFILNEILLSRADFSYFTRYVRILKDDKSGEEGPFTLWGAQRRFLREIGAVELEMHRLYAAGRERFDGNCWITHKAAQRGLSTFCQAIGVHIYNFYSGRNCLSASTNEDKVRELYQNYGYFMWKRLPRWMKQKAVSDRADTGLVFDTGSKHVLQNADQETGLGQGSKWHWSHLTECASWDANRIKDQIENHYFHRVSRSVVAMAFLESTSQGYGDWWHTTTERARRGDLERWRYFFVPWWSVYEVAVDYPPDDWRPRRETQEEWELIRRTSHEWTDDHHPFNPSREMMYFWERTFNNYERQGTLAEFYKNLPSTPDQSFVAGGRQSFPIQILTTLERQVREPVYYDIINDDKYPTSPTSLLPIPHQHDGQLYREYTVDKYTIAPVRTTLEERQNPLGLIQLFEPPDGQLKLHDTFAGIDTCDGLVDWHRHLQRKSDEDTNNACVQIGRHTLSKDIQVCVFKAPVTPVRFARYFNILGRLFSGRNALEGQIPTIIELSASGKSLQEELMTRYNWLNFYQYYRLTGADLIETEKFGWPPHGDNQIILWLAGKEHICDLNVLVRAQSTINEMRGCKDDDVRLSRFSLARGTAKKKGGKHDDEVYALMFYLMFANDFTNPNTFAAKRLIQSQPSQGRPGTQLAYRGLLPEDRERFLEEWSDRMLGGADYFQG